MNKLNAEMSAGELISRTVQELIAYRNWYLPNR